MGRSGHGAARARSRCIRGIAAAFDVTDSLITISNTNEALRQRLRCVERMRTMQPRPFDLRGDFGASVFTTLAADADRSLRSSGVRHNGKWNAPVGPAVEDFVSESGFLELVHAFSNVPLGPVRGATVIAYTKVGEHLPIHLDDTDFGEANVLLCVRHRLPRTGASATVFVTSDGVRSHVLEPGMALLFDGAATLHGRTPLSEGEEVVLISFGFASLRGPAGAGGSAGGRLASACGSCPQSESC